MNYCFVNKIDFRLELMEVQSIETKRKKTILLTSEEVKSLSSLVDSLEDDTEPLIVQIDAAGKVVL
ncbi:hypothetical protein [Enterococcus sp. AZ072]|uniref:hypothetical protein n=1 Tax=unclassified Enterococcus TaxID=2608891 RepID=UPI003D27A969